MRSFPFLLTISAVFGFGLSSLANEPTTPDSVDRGLRDVVKANTRFGVDVYRALLTADRDGSNIFISPYSLFNVLLMVTEGARGDTSREMGTALKFPDTPKIVGQGDVSRTWDLIPLHTGMAELQGRLHREKIRTANAVWVERTYPLSKSYLDVIGRFYGVNGAFNTDFRDNSEAARSRINQWVGQHTSNRIGELLPVGSVNPVTRMVVTNAAYFKGEWLEPFEAKNTQPREFRLADGGPSKALIMQAWSLESARYGAFNGDGSLFSTPREIAPGDNSSTYPADDGFAILDLPYKGGQLSMVVIAPLQPAKFSQLETGLTADNLERWLGQLSQRTVHVLLPKFKLETDYKLRGTLEHLGIVRAFTPGADLSGLTENNSATDRLQLSEVLHKAFVELDEQGTEAVAATAAVAVPTSAVFESPKRIRFIPTFRADRPFIFLIRERESGLVLFLGRVMKPITG